MQLTKLLDLVKHASAITTDYQLAKHLGLPKQRISDYYKGKAAPDEYTCLKIAEALGKPLEEIIATVKAQTEKDQERRKVWENLLKRLRGEGITLAAILSMIVTSGVTIPNGAPSGAGFGAVRICNTNYPVIRRAWLCLQRIANSLLVPRYRTA